MSTQDEVDNADGMIASPPTESISKIESTGNAVNPQKAPLAMPPKVPLAPLKNLQAKFNPLADGMLYLVVFLGGFCGTALRYAFSLLMQGEYHMFHMANFVANMLACFALACISQYVTSAVWIRKRNKDLLQRGLGVGFCGGLSTLSGLEIEAYKSIANNGSYWEPVLYITVSLICGIIFAFLGAWCAKQLLSITETRILGRAARKLNGNSHHSENVNTVHMLSEDDENDNLDATPSSNGTDDIDASMSSTVNNAQETQMQEALPSYEPAPITSEIRVIPDPMSGEVR
ncbi:MAG: CrcB family protein [Bifidobacteriaceae bacterium]|nr:CrcB family protein [Bifidobacteriaceae bacterium]